MQTNHVIGQENVSMSVATRDTKNKKIYNWLLKMAGKTVHSDGAFGLPGKYVRKVSVYAHSNDQEPEVYYMFVSEISGVNPDVSNHDPFEFTLTLTEWKTGAKVDKIE